MTMSDMKVSKIILFEEVKSELDYPNVFIILGKCTWIRCSADGLLIIERILYL